MFIKHYETPQNPDPEPLRASSEARVARKYFILTGRNLERTTALMRRGGGAHLLEGRETETEEKGVERIEAMANSFIT